MKSQWRREIERRAETDGGTAGGAGETDGVEGENVKDEEKVRGRGEAERDEGGGGEG